MESNNSNGQRPPDTFSSSGLLGMSLISTIVYVAIALLIFWYFQASSITGAFQSEYSIVWQLFIGVVAGSITAAVIAAIVSCAPVSEILHDFYIFDMISNMRLTNFDRAQVSAFAGAGEELLFRGAIQPLLGNAITSIIFVGIHGYFKFKSVGHILFGITMLALSMMLGYLFEYVGLLSAMMAHGAYDFIMLKLVQKGKL